MATVQNYSFGGPKHPKNDMVSWSSSMGPTKVVHLATIKGVTASIALELH